VFAYPNFCKSKVRKEVRYMSKDPKTLKRIPLKSSKETGEGLSSVPEEHSRPQDYKTALEMPAMKTWSNPAENPKNIPRKREYFTREGVDLSAHHKLNNFGDVVKITEGPIFFAKQPATGQVVEDIVVHHLARLKEDLEKNQTILSKIEKVKGIISPVEEETVRADGVTFIKTKSDPDGTPVEAAYHTLKVSENALSVAALEERNSDYAKLEEINEELEKEIENFKEAGQTEYEKRVKLQKENNELNLKLTELRGRLKNKKRKDIAEGTVIQETESPDVGPVTADNKQLAVSLACETKLRVQAEKHLHRTEGMLDMVTAAKAETEMKFETLRVQFTMVRKTHFIIYYSVRKEKSCSEKQRNSNKSCGKQENLKKKHTHTHAACAGVRARAQYPLVQPYPHGEGAPRVHEAERRASEMENGDGG